MAEAGIVKFCARVGQKSISFVMINCTPKWAWSVSRDLLKFWQISANISKMVQDRNILPMKTNRTSDVAYQMAQMPVTLNDCEGYFSYLTLLNSLSYWQI